ncbi:MAG: hypothetical protein A3E37_03285 [Candidatus Andersenbacteria bacterium RIFCSPHIGHO2_12_FULL_46_9]|nr:MAG: hypothetical protein A3B76_03090 [Candidatus Andersenbacteria bacterium RIFCSPHIGHO2_02_FULL_46_16]OGY35382.1 MAG: hypothetical protein A3E37_03285 [Candidatus Andersenbacteria bacterium RIFCSPHIGHO2_12_FULL_46_9]OGY36258.1 MAG: hypothetical protein A3I08_05410 [Candidatus Andersenbacteria bacterium RIFCSPLOWO2_02_FULL_46_11]HBE89911.1 hypothetical protein [Candidatus Andersenbacteria bacterium]
MKIGFISLMIGVLAVLGMVVWLGTTELEGYQAERYTANAGEMLGGVVVGQTFVGERDNLSSVLVMFATYSGRGNTGQVKFTLRRLDKLSEILREVEVSTRELGDNQMYQFNFDPVEQAKDITFIVLLELPDGMPGKAVTVDVDNRDPYHRGSAYIWRGMTGEISDTELARGGKVKMDLAFGTAYKVPLYVAWGSEGWRAVQYFRETWYEARATYGLWGRVAMQSLLLVGICLAVTVGIKSKAVSAKSRWQVARWLVTLFVLALVARILYAMELPLTNDEGNYLYDAATLLKGKLAGGDGYVKAPLVVLWIALWEWLGGTSIFVGRLSSVVIGAMTMWPMYIIGRELWSKKVGLSVATTWALLGVTVVFNIYVHTQSLAIFFAVSGIAALLLGTRDMYVSQVSMERKYRVTGKAWLIAAGALLGLGVVSRKSILATGLVPLLVILIGSKTGRQKIQSLLLVGAGFVIVLAVFLGVAMLIYGQAGLWEATGFNSVEDSITAVEESEREQVRAYSIRGMTPFFRESLPLIMLAVLGLGFAGERLASSLVGQMEWWQGGLGWRQNVVQKLFWIIPVMVYSWAWSFFQEYEGSSIMVFGMYRLWWAMLLVIVFMAAWPSGVRENKNEKIRNNKDDTERLGKEELLEYRGTLADGLAAGKIDRLGNQLKSEGRWNLLGWLLPFVWVVGLVFFYHNWIKFHANYIGEFLPPLVIIAGLAIPEGWRRLTQGQGSHSAIVNKVSQRTLALGFIGVLGWSLFVANYVTYVHEHTGTFQLTSLQEAANWAKQNIPIDEPIFTGAAAIPFLSGHEVSLDIAHPRWYAYGFTRTDTARLNAFLPTVEEMLQAYRDAEWLLLEQQTGFSFLMEYEEIEAGLARNWQAVKGIENGSNTMTYYRRKR